MFRQNFDMSKPHMTIDTPCCIQSLAYHPSDPSVLASGSVNGEIFIWNTNFDEMKGESDKNKQMFSKSTADEYFHREPISKLLWVELPVESSTRSEREVVLLSTSTDGKVLIWNSPVVQLRYPIKGHLLVGGQMSLGGTTMVLSGSIKSEFEDMKLIIGTEVSTERHRRLWTNL